VAENTESNSPAETVPAETVLAQTAPAQTLPTQTLPTGTRPGAEWVIKDIDRSVEYRKKYYEYSITIATALLAFSISFPPTLTAVHYVFLVRIAWLALGVSILCGVSIHFAWSKFFISFRNLDNRGHRDEGELRRKKWTSLRKTMELVQFLTLLIGVMGMSVFAGVNYQYIASHPTENNPPPRPVPPQH
jgi:hypothetical protein